MNKYERIEIFRTNVYILNIGIVESIPTSYFAEYYPNRYAASEQFVFKEDRLRSLGVGYLLKDVLGLREEDIRTGEYGKPYSDAIDECFSISHSGDYVVLAVSPHNIGVDIERIDERHFDVADIVYTDTEIEWYKQDSENTPGENFYRLWTLKECVSKITGEGLNTDYKSFTVMPLINDGSMSYEGRRISGESVINPSGYCLSVCLEEE